MKIILKEKKIPVILDTDIGTDLDDSWALGLLLKCPELDVKLITTTSQNTTIKAKIVAKFLENADRTDIPIGIGPKVNNVKGPLFNWVKEYNLNDYPGEIYEDGVEIVCQKIMESSRPLTLVCIGPLGNIAEAIKLKPEITQNARFVGMQGSIRIGYESSSQPDVEYNVVYNIKACREVFQAPWEKTITPLDTCGNIRLSGDNYQKVLDCDNKIIKNIKEHITMWTKKIQLKHIITQEHSSSILYDTVATYLAFSEDLLNIENLKIKVSEKGMTEIKESGSEIRCATSWKDIQKFKDLIVDRLIN